MYTEYAWSARGAVHLESYLRGRGRGDSHGILRFFILDGPWLSTPKKQQVVSIST